MLGTGERVLRRGIGWIGRVSRREKPCAGLGDEGRPFGVVGRESVFPGPEGPDANGLVSGIPSARERRSWSPSSPLTSIPKPFMRSSCSCSKAARRAAFSIFFISNRFLRNFCFLCVFDRASCSFLNCNFCFSYRKYLSFSFFSLASVLKPPLACARS